jgi:hypothetical protein
MPVETTDTPTTVLVVLLVVHGGEDTGSNSVIAESTKVQVSICTICICNQFVSGGSSFETLDGSEDGTCC